MHIFKKLFIKKAIFDGMLDSVTPTKISGWCFSEVKKLSEVTLYLGPHLINKSKIEISRKDVNSEFNLVGNHGFEINLPNNLPDSILNLDPKIVASSIDNKFKREIYFLRNQAESKLKLKKLFNKEILGFDGHVDGLLHDNKIHGWACKRNDFEKSNIWLHYDEMEPILINCSYERPDVESNEIKINCGFRIDPIDLPNVKSDSKLFFSFDKEGLLPLPIQNEIYLKNFPELISIPFKNSKSKDQITKREPLDIDLLNNEMDEYCQFLDLLEIQLKRENLLFWYIKKLISNLKK